VGDEKPTYEELLKRLEAVEKGGKDAASTLDKDLGSVLSNLEAAFSKKNTAKITEYAKALADMGPPLNASAEQLKEYEEKLNKVIDAYNRSDHEKGATAMANGFAKIGINAADAEDNIVSLTVGILGTRAGFNGMIDGMVKAIQEGHIWGSVLKETENITKDYFKQLDQARQKMNKFAGANQMYYDSAVQAEQATRKHNVSLEMTADATRAAGENISQFNKFSQAQRTELVGNIAVLDRAGVSADTAAENIQFLNLSLGMSPKAAANAQVKIVSLANEIGKSTQEMASDFANAKGDLAKYGASAVDMFVKLQKASKEAGMEMNELLSITNKFDTFDSAAQQVGTLNAMLGGPYLNSMEMVMETDPTKRIDMLSGAVKSAGLSFESMNYYQKQAIANAMELEDVNDLAKIMQGSFDDVSASTGTFADNMEELKEKSDKFATFSEEIDTIRKALIVDFVEPLIPLLHTVSSTLTAIAHNPVTRTLVILGAAFFMLHTAILKIAAAKAGLATVYSAFSGVKTIFAGTTKAVTSAIVEESAVAPAAASSSFSLSAAMMSFVPAIPVMWTFAGVLVALALAAAGIGVGIWLAADGMKAFLEPVGEFLTNVSFADMMQLPAFIAALAFSFLGFVYIASLLPAIGLGLGLVAGSIVALGALGWVVTKVLKPMANSLTSIVTDLDKVKTSATTTRTALNELKDILNTGITNPFAPMVKSANALVESIKQISIEMGPLQNKNPLTPLMNAPMMASFMAVAPALVAMQAVSTAPTPAATQEITLVAKIELDGNAMAEHTYQAVMGGKAREAVEMVAASTVRQKIA